MATDATIIRTGTAQKQQTHAAEQVEASRQRRQRVREAVRGLADDYHPFDATTGAPKTVEGVGQSLNARLEAIERVVEEANLGEKSRQAVTRVRRWLTPLMATIGWFWSQAEALLELLGLSEEAEEVVRNQLLPGLYWADAACRGRDPEQRRQRRALSERLLAGCWAASSPLSELAEEKQTRVREIARCVVRCFHRSSSCVEGRNGRLSLYHHGQGGLCPGRLKALTTLHNYLPKGRGETAAERFFGVKPADLFEWLLSRLPELPRPRKRSQNPPATVKTEPIT